VRPAIGKPVARTDDDVAERAGDEHLAGAGAGHHTGGDVNADTTDSAILASLHFTEMYTDTHFEAEIAPRDLQRPGTFDGSPRILER